jgi:hypothetical protein
MKVFILLIFLSIFLLLKAQQQNLAIHELPLPNPIIIEDINLSTSTTSSSSLPNNSSIPSAQNSSNLGTTAPLTSQLAKPPSKEEREMATTMAGIQQTDNLNRGKMRSFVGAVARRSSPGATTTINHENEHRHNLKPETKDEMFARMDSDGDSIISLQDYMNRDRFYVESVKTEFNDIDTNGIFLM